MRLFAACVASLVLSQAPLGAQDGLAEARRLYNAGQYDAAEQTARSAMSVPSTSDGARVVLGRILLERFRQTGSDIDLSNARAELRHVTAAALGPRERLELMVGLAEGLFLEERFAAAAAMFEPLITPSGVLGPSAHERVLDWWATALDRHVTVRPQMERADVYARISSRMAQEVERDPGSGPGSYWLVAAARGAGDLDAAWSQAMAGWLRAPLTRDRGVALRADLDRLVLQALIPELAARVTGREATQATAAMTAEWETFKAGWSR
ncbi:MAG TPA: hypothetical protein VNJ03_01375 [Vicinamibacterales bacterium]|nr:hypothetical protein [Vicinamibacterales bacterium]